MSAAAGGAAGSPATSSLHRRRLTLAAMCVSQGMIMIDITIVNTALPAIQRGLHMSTGSLEWVISAYALSLAALIPLGGALGDRYGRKRVFLVGMVIFTLGSIACAVATSDGALIGARAVQGVGGAAMSALTLSILTDTYPPEDRARAIGLWAAIGGMGFGLGPVAGGLLLTAFDWSSVFWVNVPVAAVGLVLTAVAVRSTRSAQPRPLDPVGVLTSALGLLGITLGLIESSNHPWGSWPVAGPLVLGVALLAGFAVWESRAPSPMVPPVLLRARSFATSTGVYLLAYLALQGVMFYVTLLYQDVNGWSPLRTGLSWLTMNLPFLGVAQFAGRLHARYSSARVVATGCLVAAVGIGILATLTATTPFVWAGVGYVLLGAGYGALVPGVASTAMHDVPSEVSGAASGVLNAARQAGTSVGLAVLGAIGVGAATSAWSATVSQAPAAVRPVAADQAQHVAAAQVHTVVGVLGEGYRGAAVDAFVHGYHVAIAVAAGCMVLAGVAAALGLRATSSQPGAAPPSERLAGDRAAAPVQVPTSPAP